MSTARKTEPQIEKPNLRERAKVARGAAERATRQRTVSVAAPQLCAAGQLGEMLEALWAEYDKWDDLRGTWPADLVDHMLVEVSSKIHDLELGISYARAASPAGMLAQLAVASTGLDLTKSGATEDIRSSSERMTTRCLLSVAAALCKMTGVDRDGFSAKRSLPSYMDKLAVLDAEAAR